MVAIANHVNLKKGDLKQKKKERKEKRNKKTLKNKKALKGW